MLDKLDIWLSLIDIVLCCVDIGIIIWLFFYRFPAEKKKPNQFKKFYRKRK